MIVCCHWFFYLPKCTPLEVRSPSSSPEATRFNCGFTSGRTRPSLDGHSIRRVGTHDPSWNTRPHIPSTPHECPRTPKTTSASGSTHPTRHARLPSPNSIPPTDDSGETARPNDRLPKHSSLNFEQKVKSPCWHDAARAPPSQDGLSGLT
jgi:hypothetical protein